MTEKKILQDMIHDIVMENTLLKLFIMENSLLGDYTEYMNEKQCMINKISNPENEGDEDGD